MQKLPSIIACKTTRKFYLPLLLLCITFSTAAQFTLRIEITATPPAYQEEGIFAAGSFNNWDPGNNKFLFSKINNKWVLEIGGLSARQYQFKFTRGSWQKVETTHAGSDIDNRTVLLTADTTIQCAIDGWREEVTAAQKHTASVNVHIIDTAFFIPQLNRYRRIWMYLPPGYASAQKKYPVLYMQDGQNLFDAATAAYGEWGVDELMDSLLASKKQECLIVGIDHGGNKRMSEYNPYEFIVEEGSKASQKFIPEGDAYIDFITQTLKPFIDSHYRTLPSKENTIIAGSSMGGVISYYATLKYPGVYGKAGIFSPAYWTASKLSALTDSISGKVSAKYFFYMGGLEGEKNIALMDEMTDRLGAASGSMIYSVTDARGKHNEAAWHKWFAEFYNWIMADGYNYITQTVE